MALCSVCGLDTQCKVDSDGVLCSEHYDDYCYEEKGYVDEFNREMDEIKERYIDTSDHYYFTSRLHEESSGQYDHKCERCESTFYNNDYYYGDGLCPSCTDYIKGLMKEAYSKEYYAKRRYYRRLDSLVKRFKQRTTFWSQELENLENSHLSQFK